MDQFLDLIKVNTYEVTITNLRMDNGMTLKTYIGAIPHHHLVLTHHRVQECHFIKIIYYLNLEEDVSGPGKTSTYIKPEVWQGLSSEQCRTFIQAQEKKSQEQVEVKKQPYAPKNAGKARRVKAAKARRAIAAREAQTTDNV